MKKKIKENVLLLYICMYIYTHTCYVCIHVYVYRHINICHVYGLSMHSFASFAKVLFFNYKYIFF